MPPPQAIVCHICNGKYFKRSFPIHLKQCEAKWKKTHSRCQNCGTAVANHDWSDHRAHCKPVKRTKQARKAVNSAPLEPPKADYQQVVPTHNSKTKVIQCEECETEKASWKCMQCEQSLCTMCEVDLHRKGARARHDRVPLNVEALKQANLSECKEIECSVALSPPKALPNQDHRMECKFCSRRFHPDRVEKHQRICSKLKKKKKRRLYDAAKKRIQGTEFEAYQFIRSKTPEKVKQWKKHSRRWKSESALLREVAAINADLRATKEIVNEKKDEEPEIIIKSSAIPVKRQVKQSLVGNNKRFPVPKKPVNNSRINRENSKPKVNKNTNANVSLRGNTMKMKRKERPASNTSSTNSSSNVSGSQASRRSVVKVAKRSTIAQNRRAEAIAKKKAESSTTTVSRRQRSKKPPIPKFTRKRSTITASSASLSSTQSNSTTNNKPPKRTDFLRRNRDAVVLHKKMVKSQTKPSGTMKTETKLQVQVQKEKTPKVTKAIVEPTVVEPVVKTVTEPKSCSTAITCLDNTMEKENKSPEKAEEIFYETKKTRISKAKALPRGLDLGMNVKPIFDDIPKTMTDYMERERLRRQRAIPSVSKTVAVESKQIKKQKVPVKHSRLETKKNIRVENERLGGTQWSKPRNAQDLSMKRAAYFETLLRNQE